MSSLCVTETMTPGILFLAASSNSQAGSTEGLLRTMDYFRAERYVIYVAHRWDMAGVHSDRDTYFGVYSDLLVSHQLSNNRILSCTFRMPYKTYII